TTGRGAAFLAVLAAGALTRSACGGSDDEPESNDDAGAEEGNGEGGDEGDGDSSSGTITVASDAEFTSYNANSATGNGTWNTFVLNGVLSGVWDYLLEGGTAPVAEF